MAKEDAKGIQRKRYEDGRRASRVKELEKEVVCPKSDEKEGIRRFFFSDEKGDQKQSVEKKKFFVFPVAKSPFLAFYFTKRENINRKKEEGKW